MYRSLKIYTTKHIYIYKHLYFSLFKSSLATMFSCMLKNIVTKLRNSNYTYFSKWANAFLFKWHLLPCKSRIKGEVTGTKRHSCVCVCV